MTQSVQFKECGLNVALVYEEPPLRFADLRWFQQSLPLQKTKTSQGTLRLFPPWFAGFEQRRKLLVEPID